MIGRFLGAAFMIATFGLYPLVAAPAPAWATRVTWHRDGLLTWERVERRATKPTTIHRLAVNLAPGRSKLIAAGRPGTLEIWVRYAQRDGGPVRRSVLGSRIVRAAKPRIVADGIGAAPLSSFEARGVAQMGYMARGAIVMLATAYTANCAGCGGMTAIGRRAGYGIVAVDPRIIPLGTRLYIPGYGLAVAGDTGGDIVGRRIDLGFDTWRDAMLFGRRAIEVYQLK